MTPSTEPRQFFGHPLTPQPQPMDRRGRARAVARIEASDAAVSDPVVLAHLIEANRVLFEHVSRPAHKRVLWSGAARLDSTGVWSNRAGGGLASGALWIYSPTVPVIVAAGTRQGFAPLEGPGVFYVPANVELTLNAHTPQWTLYGQSVTAPSTTVTGLTAIGAVPAAGASAVYVLPTAISLEAIDTGFVASATVANRTITLLITDPSGNTILRSGLSVTVTASQSLFFTWAGGNTFSSVAGGSVQTGPIPPLQLAVGSTITVSANGIQAGDQFSALTVSGTAPTTVTTSPVNALVNVAVYSDHQELVNR